MASGLVGVFRGFVREVLGLGSWIAAFVAAMFFSAPASAALSGQIATPSLRIAAGYSLVFFGVLLVGSIVTHFAAMAVRQSALSGVDRTVGGGFGLLRGALLAMLLVWLAGKTPARDDPWWKQSFLIGHVETLTAGIGQWLPSGWTGGHQGPAPAPESA